MDFKEPSGQSWDSKKKENKGTGNRQKKENNRWENKLDR